MAQILIRGVSAETLRRLKARAKRHQRTVQQEVKEILDEAAAMSMPDAQRLSEEWQTRLAGQKHSDSTDLIREERNR